MHESQCVTVHSDNKTTTRLRKNCARENVVHGWCVCLHKLGVTLPSNSKISSLCGFDKTMNGLYSQTFTSLHSRQPRLFHSKPGHPHSQGRVVAFSIHTLDPFFGHSFHTWSLSKSVASLFCHSFRISDISVDTSCSLIISPREIPSAIKATTPCPVLSCPVLSCPVLSCPVLSCPVLSCPVLSCPVLSCPVLFQISFFTSCCNHKKRTSTCRVFPSPCRADMTLVFHSVTPMVQHRLDSERMS